MAAEGHYPPLGEEKEILDRFNSLVDEFDNISKAVDLARPTGHGVSIEVGHALEGVRMNGRQQATTVLDVYRGIKEYDDEFQRLARLVVRSAARVKKQREWADWLMQTFIVCPVCHGKKGEKTPASSVPFRTGSWGDCHHCGGRGVVKRKGNRVERKRS